KWKLPADYPMVAPNYARKRSELARATGLGKKSAQSSPKRRPGVRLISADTAVTPDNSSI
ncbi:MucR family transcriptional regulator, partial [Sinorhizobium medicae]